MLQVTQARAQKDNECFEKPSDAIYVTGLEFGVVQASESNFSEGLMFKWCSEYRFKRYSSPFIRLNIDTYDMDYVFNNKSSYELTGKTQFIDFIIGGGYRLGKRNIKLLISSQVGASMFAYPGLKSESNPLVIEEGYMTSLVTRLTVGVEYYLDPRLALSFEIFSNTLHSNTGAWSNTMNVSGFTIGFTSVIF